MFRSYPSRCILSSVADSRRGSITVLAAVMLTALVIIGAVSMNLTQLSMSKTEVRLACDAAAKAGAVVLGQSQSVGQARQAARDVASQHTVNGHPILIRDIDVIFGNSEPSNSGSYTFNANQTPLNAVRVHANLADGSGTDRGAYFIQGIGGQDYFELHYTATATRVDHDICLVVDRSASMAWDMSNNDWVYPGVTDQSIMQNYFLAPHPTLSRWAALTRATDLFFTEVDELPIEVKVGLVSYSSNFTFGLYSSVASTIESEMVTNTAPLQQRMVAIGTDELIGNTNIASGMQAAVQVLTGSNARITAKKTMIVLTDGRWNQGSDPVSVAAAANAANITVHTITFSEQSDQATMAAVAAAGSGTHYHAPNEATLQEAFSEIVATLPAVLTE